MPVRARLSRYKASLLDKKPLPHPLARRTWSWSAGSAVDELTLHEAQRYLANDWDVEAVFLNATLYDALGNRASSGMWEPSDEVYDPHAVIKQAKHAKLPYVEVKVAIPGRWLDTAVKLKSGAAKTGHKLAPVARKGYKLAREQVRKHRSPQDRVSTHTAQARLSFAPGPSVSHETLREQLAKARVLLTTEQLEALRKMCIELARSKVRVVDSEGVMHLAEVSMEPPKVFCGIAVGQAVGQVLTPSNRGSVWAMPGDPSPSNAKLLCPDCARIAEQGVPAPEADVREPTTEQPWVPDEKERETFIGALSTASLRSCPGCERDYGAEGVSCHRTGAEGWICEESVMTDPEISADVAWAREAYETYARVLEGNGKLHLARLGTQQFGQLLCGRQLAGAPDPVPQVALPGERLHGTGSVPSLEFCEACDEVFRTRRPAKVSYRDGEAPPPEWPEAIAQEEQMAALVDRPRLVDLNGVMHLAFVLVLDPERLQESLTRCKFELRLAKGAQRYVSCAFPGEPTPAEAVSVCLACVNGKSPAAAVAQPQDPQLPTEP